ncbi:MAG: diaminopimelate epimerase, partial [Planctomycetes bacterium]|nr:diaminopimelate epimerase [Planctomycetota bacterium]
MRFTKMHGLGNDYVYVDCFDQSVDDPTPLARAVSDRHCGIGSDGLIMIMPSDKADVRMRMFNKDGTEGEMCGNGIRCVAKYAYEHDRTKGREISHKVFFELLDGVIDSSIKLREITVETGRGVLPLALLIKGEQVERICVNMGEPLLLPSQIPVSVIGQQAVGVPLKIEDHDYLMSCVSMGNPHVVIFINNVKEFDLEHIGPLVEHHPIFPERINVHFAQTLSVKEVIMRTWERGTGLTQACGTGASAVCVAG